MTPEGVLTLLKKECGDAIESIEPTGLHPCAVVRAADWPRVARFLRDDPRLTFDWLRCIAGVDELEDDRLCAVYELHATGLASITASAAPQTAAAALPMRVQSEIAIKVRVPRSAPHIPTVSDVWPAANWHEREAFDLLGIVFDGHPDLRRILCCDDWVGHPLRKDYEFPLEYHGIPGTTELSQTRPVH